MGDSWNRGYRNNGTGDETGSPEVDLPQTPVYHILGRHDERIIVVRDDLVIILPAKRGIHLTAR